MTLQIRPAHVQRNLQTNKTGSLPGLRRHSWNAPPSHLVAQRLIRWSSGVHDRHYSDPRPNRPGRCVSARTAVAAGVWRVTSVEALSQLNSVDPLKAELVELRYFAGLTGGQAADVLKISPSTADRHWVFARAWLQAEVRGAWRRGAYFPERPNPGA